MDPARLLELPGVIELFGEAGSGKSQFCHYLSANFVTKNIDKRVLYLALDRRYRCSRFFEYLRRLNPSSGLSLGNNVLVHEEWRSENLHTFLTQGLVNSCNDLNIGLVVIDSLAAVFRLTEQSEDKFMLFEIMKALRSAHHKSGASIIVVNQVSAKIGSGVDFDFSEDQTLSFKPALGLQWSNCVDHRLLVSKDKGGENLINCTTLRSPLLAPGSVYTLEL